MEFKDRLKALRLENKLTQQELGAKVGLKKEAIYKYEKGIVVNPKRDLIAKLARLFNVSPSYLLCLSDARFLTTSDYTQEEKTYILMIRQLNDVGKERLTEQLEYLLSKEKYVKKTISA